MKKIIFTFFLIAFISIIPTTVIRYFKPQKSYGKVIIVNGPSAAGKSSIQKEFQNLMMAKFMD